LVRFVPTSDKWRTLIDIRIMAASGPCNILAVKLCCFWANVGVVSVKSRRSASVEAAGRSEVERCPVEAIAIGAMAVVKWLQQFLRQESNATRAALGLAVAGHVIIALLLMLGAFTRTEATSVVTTPVEIVMEKPDAQASSPPTPASNEQNTLSGVPAVADVDKRAKAPLQTVDVNGIDRPKQPGHDGGDPRPDRAAIDLPSADGELASGAASLPSWAVEPIGLAQPQTTTREPGEDEMTAIKEQKVECGAKARWSSPAAGIRQRGRVTGIATEAQALALIRSSQVVTDRHINSNYIKKQQVVAESLDSRQKTSAVLRSGLTVNVGDVVQIVSGHVDPSDPCQYIPNVVVRKP
jgi:hypothetical protein